MRIFLSKSFLFCLVFDFSLVFAAVQPGVTGETQINSNFSGAHNYRVCMDATCTDIYCAFFWNSISGNGNTLILNPSSPQPSSGGVFSSSSSSSSEVEPSTTTKVSKKKKKRTQWLKNDTLIKKMRDALLAIKEGAILTETAKKFDIPPRTLRRYAKKQREGG